MESIHSLVNVLLENLESIAVQVSFIDFDSNVDGNTVAISLSIISNYYVQSLMMSSDKPSEKKDVTP